MTNARSVPQLLWFAVLLGIAAATALMARTAIAAGQPYVMKLSTATLNDSQHEWMRMFAAAVTKDSGGRIKPELFPASQLGTTPRQIEGTQLGSIQGVVLPPEFLVGVDPRFEVLSTPGVFTSVQQANRVISDAAFNKAFLTLGANKGLVGISLFISAPTAVLTRNPVRHLADFRGLKLRVLASKFQEVEISRLGATPVAMSLTDVMPALQQGAIDGTLATVTTFTPLHYYDAAKYLTETGHYYVFSCTELSKKWFDALPPDLQAILRTEGAKMAQAIVPWQVNFIAAQRRTWVAHGGELISLPPAEEAKMMQEMASVGDDVTKSDPASHKFYEMLLAAVKRNS